MKKKGNYLGISLFAASLAAGGIYFAALYFYPAISKLFLVFALLLAIFGFVSIVNEAAHRFPLPFKPMIHWTHSIIFEIPAVLFTFLIKPFGSRCLSSCGSKEGRPILLIHGYLQNASNWLYFKEALCAKGLGPIYALNLEHPFRSIREFAQRVSEKAERIAQETGRLDLVLIGHSMGGLVSAWYATQLDCVDKEVDVITIGSPIGGTRLAAIALGVNGQEMRRESDFVKTLRTQMEKQSKRRFFHIGSKADQIIIPQSSAWTGLYPQREYLVDDLGHMSLLFSQRVVEKIHEWIT